MPGVLAVGSSGLKEYQCHNPRETNLFLPALISKDPKNRSHVLPRSHRSLADGKCNMIGSSRVSVSPRSELVRASQVELVVQIRLPVKEAQVLSLAQEGPLDKEMATHSSSLAWKIPRTEEPGRQATVHGGCKEWDVTEHAQKNTRVGCSKGAKGTMTLHPLTLQWTCVGMCSPSY